MESLSLFIGQIYQAPSLVWTLAFLMSAISGYMLHSYIGDYLFASVSACALFVAILIAHVAFTEMGVFFTTDKESNIAASAGAAVCSVTLITVVMLRLWHAARAGYADLSD
jgi:tryptophan-rich sensory protein